MEGVLYIHTGVIVRSAYQNLSTHGYHVLQRFRGSPKKPMDLTHFQFEKRSRATRCRFLQPFAVPDKAVQFQRSGGKLRRESVVTVPVCLLPPLPPPPQPATATATTRNNKEKDTHTHTHMYLYMYMYMYMHMYMYMYMCMCMCMKVYVYAHMKKFMTFYNGFMYFATSLFFYIYIYRKYIYIYLLCHHESSKTPQHSKLELCGHKQATAHQKVESFKKNNLRSDKNRIRIC